MYKYDWCDLDIIVIAIYTITFDFIREGLQLKEFSKLYDMIYSESESGF